MITNQTVKQTADLIKIKLKDSELETFKKQLEKALEPADVLNELNTREVKITSQTIDTKNIFREDQTRPSLPQEQALLNANLTKNGYIVVKRVLK